MQTKTFLATDENMQSINDFVHAALPPDCPEDVIFKIDVAVEEIYINIAHYAYDPDVGMAKISIDTVKDENGKPRMVISFADKGRPYDPLSAPEPDIEAELDDRRIGGLGVFLVRAAMDSVEYEHKDGQNITTIEKELSEQEVS